MIVSLGQRPAIADRHAAAEVAKEFEALLVAQMLKSARAATLADDPLGGAGTATFTDLVDQTRAQALSAQAPLGVARLLSQ
ncbi:MAG: rod-binding protein [Janthinobacterium lividum]